MATQKGTLAAGRGHSLQCAEEEGKPLIQPTPVHGGIGVVGWRASFCGVGPGWHARTLPAGSPLGGSSGCCWCPGPCSSQEGYQ